ncbi:MAG: hypothetical protein ACR2HR_13050 [Euzebya sp.]
MSQVWVRRDEAQRGGLPARCARSGQRCITRYRHGVSDLPAAIEWSLWSGLWPRNRQADPPVVILPLLPSRQRWEQLLRRSRDITAAAVPLSLLLLAVTGDGIPRRLAWLLCVGAVMLHLIGAAVGLLTTVEVRSDRVGEWVRLGGVHPEFAAAAEQRMSRPTHTPVLAEHPFTSFGRRRPEATTEPAGES